MQPMVNCNCWARVQPLGTKNNYYNFLTGVFGAIELNLLCDWMGTKTSPRFLPSFYLLGWQKKKLSLFALKEKEVTIKKWILNKSSYGSPPPPSAALRNPSSCPHPYLFLYEVSFPLSQTQSNIEHRYWNQSGHVAGEPVGQVRQALPSHVTKRNPKPPKEKGYKPNSVYQEALWRLFLSGFLSCIQCRAPCQDKFTSIHVYNYIDI